LIELRKARAPPPFWALENSAKNVRRSSRVSDSSTLRTWPNWTGTAVWLTGIVPPVSMTGADGVPGWRSTNSLPSRKIRGRMSIVASVWIGRPNFSISISIRAPSAPGATGSTFVTVPASTPAIRTSESALRLLTVLKTALSL
jgi:hypothetical protein